MIVSSPGVVPSYQVADGAVEMGLGGYPIENRLYRVRWHVAYPDEDGLGLQDRLQSLSESGWTVFSILTGSSVIAYRYEADEDG